MIVTLTPNPAIDVTYRLPALTMGESHRVTDQQRRAGGKGVNTASVLARTGHPHTCLSAVDTDTAPWWDADLAARGITTSTVPVTGWRTRSSVAVVTDDGAATVLNETGDEPPAHVWDDLAARAVTLLVAPPQSGVPDGVVLVVSGSLPGATQDQPPGALLGLVRTTRLAGHPVVVDGSGAWLREALACNPALVTPNAAEAAATTGETDPLRAAEVLVAAGAHAALVSCGADGVVLALDDGRRWWARPGRVLAGNPTGAGDAATAAAAAYLTTNAPGEDPELLLRQVVAWSGAAVQHPLAGDLDPHHLPGLAAAAVVVERR